MSAPPGDDLRPHAGSVWKRWLPRGVHWRRILFGPAAGAEMPLDLAYQTRIFLGVYERELWPHFRRLLRPGMRSFDIGGRDGYCALLIHRLTKSEVICFECDAAQVPPLRETLARNSPELQVVEATIGAGLTLDQASRVYFTPDFIKMDVEGAEAPILEQAEETLARGPGLIVEVHGESIEERCLSTLSRHGYTVTIVNLARFLPEHRSLKHNRWLVAERL